MSQHPIEGLMASVLENLKKVVDANTVIGEPLNLPNGTSIIPVTKLACGFGCGGGEYGKQGSEVKMPFGGGTGGGISVQPLGFIAVTADDVKFVHIDADSPVGNIETIVDAVVKLCKTLGKKKAEKEEGSEEEIIVEAEAAPEETPTEA